MRTTLAIDDDILELTRELAQQQGLSLGSAFSLLAKRGLAASMPRHKRNGFAVFDVPDNHRQIGLEDVQKALAEEDAAAVSLMTGERPGR